MANVTYTVKSGDTLSKIASKYNTTVSNLAKINNISNVNLIYVGQVLIISRSSGSTEPEPVKKDTANMAVINNFGLQSNTDRTVFATWTWSKANTENYRIVWDYYTNGIWFSGQDSTTENKDATYNAPSNATQVRFRVIPISQTHTVKKKETTYWTAEWSSYKTYSFSDNPPVTPNVPDVEIKDYKLTAKLENIDPNTASIQFQVVKNNTAVFKTSNTTVKTNYAQYSCYVDAGADYKVRCRAVRDGKYSEWSEYSSNATTKPSASSGITTCKATSETSVFLAWSVSTTATAYDIEYATKKEYLDGSNATTTVNGIETNHYELTGLESGQEYFFRVRATNDQGESAWSAIKSVVIGKTPVAPTTWSSTTTCITGETLTLYWTHNSEDNSSQTYAEVELYIDGKKATYTVNTTAEEDDEKTMHYAINTSKYVEGTSIKWRVRTSGVTKEYGAWSIQRTVDIYSPPTFSISVTTSTGAAIETINSFPFYISGTTGPRTQDPIGYHVSIVSNEIYSSVDNLGNAVTINAGEAVYSRHFDTYDQLRLELSADSVNLANNVSYTVKATAAMDSGLTAEDEAIFTVSWTDEAYIPNAEIGIDYDNLSAFIRPYCVDENGEAIEGISLSVYRREFDGSFTELMTGIANDSYTFITDPHPALDYARYRIVATTDATGAVSYYDIPAYPVGETSIIIQWDETWFNFNNVKEDDLAQPTWSGSLLRLPYNVDVSDEHGQDVSLVKYIGRAHPVTYYGTQLGKTATWATEIPKTDTETLHGLRRLASWMGDVYVREPSGSGYWANISVSFNQKHRSLTIPITFKITRVEGGA